MSKQIVISLLVFVLTLTIASGQDATKCVFSTDGAPVVVNGTNSIEITIFYSTTLSSMTASVYDAYASALKIFKEKAIFVYLALILILICLGLFFLSKNKKRN